MRALIRSYSARPESKAILENIRSTDKARWHSLVRQCRIRDTLADVGVDDLKNRKKAVVEGIVRMTQAFGVRDTTDVLWLTRSRFIAHQVYVEGIAGATLAEKEEAAAQKWARDVANPDVLRRGAGADTQLGVVGVPRTEGYRVRESTRSVTCVDTVNTIYASRDLSRCCRGGLYTR